MSCGSATKIFTPLVGNDTIRLGFSTPSPQCKCAKKDKTRAEIRNSALSVSALSSQLPALRPQTQSDFYLNMWHVACICALQRALSGVFLHVPGTRGISPGYFFAPVGHRLNVLVRRRAAQVGICIRRAAMR